MSQRPIKPWHDGTDQRVATGAASAAWGATTTPSPGMPLNTPGVAMPSQGSVAGVLQVNVRVPSNARSGDAMPFNVVIGAQWTGHQATVAVR